MEAVSSWILSTALELSRAIEFGLGAENPACVTDLKNIAVDYQIDYNSLQNTGIEEDDDND